MRKLGPTDALTWMRDTLTPTPRVYIPGCSGEPLIFANAMANTPDLTANTTFFGIWIPGVNRTDYAGLHETARSETIFLSTDLRASFDARRIALRPLTYTQAYPWLEQTPVDAALLQVAPPDKDGNCSLGVSADFTPAIWHRATIKIAHVNPLMPSTKGALRIPFNAFDCVVEEEYPLLEVAPSQPSADHEAIAAHIADMIDDGSVLQFGLGTLQSAVLTALKDRRNLRIHSGMVSDPVSTLLDCGAIADQQKSIKTGVAIGTAPLYEKLSQDSRVEFAPVSYTHAIETLRQIDNFHAINSVIEVDLFGQANGEYFGDTQISGAGGLVDFLRGAALSKNGKPIIALPSTAKRGTISRIVPKLTAPSISIARADTHFVATEHGIADLRSCTIDQRAQRLIAIAHPDHRGTLEQEWQTLRNAL